MCWHTSSIYDLRPRRGLLRFHKRSETDRKCAKTNLCNVQEGATEILAATGFTAVPCVRSSGPFLTWHCPELVTCVAFFWLVRRCWEAPAHGGLAVAKAAQSILSCGDLDLFGALSSRHHPCPCNIIFFFAGEVEICWGHGPHQCRCIPQVLLKLVRAHGGNSNARDSRIWHHRLCCLDRQRNKHMGVRNCLKVFTWVTGLFANPRDQSKRLNVFAELAARLMYRSMTQ